MKRTPPSILRLPHWAAGVLLLLATLPHGGQPVAAAGSGDKLVLAFFYCWYGPGAFASGQTSDRPVTPYISDHPDVIDRQIREAQAAGIDAFISSWTGAGTETARNFPLLLAAAAAHNFKMTAYFEADAVAQHGDVVQQLRDLIAATSNHPAFLRWHGKPVLFFWRAEAVGTPTQWRAIRQQVDPTNAMIWSADSTDVNYLDAFDTIHFFSGGKWQAATDVAAVDAQWRHLTDQYNQTHGTQRLWVAGVIPGWDESRIQPPRPAAKVFPRQNGDLYQADWQAAIASNPDWITITSYNEWFEGTQIEPSASYGTRYLDLTRAAVAQYKGQAVPVAPPPGASPADALACNSGAVNLNGYALCGAFRQYWYDHGDMTQQGYPISGIAVEPSLTEAGKSYQVQYFERAVFEYHPENAGTPYAVLLAQLGTARLQNKYPAGPPPATPNQRNGRYFPETGHWLGGAFRAYWEQHGGLAQQGYPISDEFAEPSELDPGQHYTVQYFERAVFEYHPENVGTPYEVLLAQLGTYRLRALAHGTVMTQPLNGFH